MERAAQGVVRAIDDRVPKDAHILILCGPGNNGGDGFAVLRQLHERGHHAEAWLAVSEESLRGDALIHYRRALDAYAQAGPKYVFDQSLKEELIKSASRQFCTGFYFGKPEQDLEKTLSPDRKYCFAAVVRQDAENGRVLVEQRNRFFVGDELEVLSPALWGEKLAVEEIRNQDGETQPSAPHPQQKLYLPCTLPLKAGDILRKVL